MAKNYVKTNDIKKGMRVRLRNGWFGTMADNKRGNLRMVTVEGILTDTGSIYAYNILGVEIDGEWHLVEHTKAQLELKKEHSAMGF